ncbi:MAG: hypothetical protein LYZ66_04535 [Nitrososphaerales archaeon]|nr:hypothetical protein [Nitrososphaerales archaeon]
MKIGNYEVPDMRLHPTLTDSIKTMYNKFAQAEVDFVTLAPVLGHKTANSGSFTTKLAMMRAYRLVDGRGKARVTDTGRKIALPTQGTEEENEGYIEAVTNVPLWKELYEKYTRSSSDLPDADFWLILRQITGVTPEEAKTKAETVRKAYLEDIRRIRVPKQGETKPSSEPQSGGQGLVGTKPSPTINEEVISFEGGALRLTLPKENITQTWKKARRMIDAYLGTTKDKD